MSSSSFESHLSIGELVYFGGSWEDDGIAGYVKRVTFSKRKVTYDLTLVGGGQTLRNVDSTLVHSTEED